MARPTEKTVFKWRKLAAKGLLYSEIQRMPAYRDKFTSNQIRHYCMGRCGRDMPGPLATAHRWGGTNPWLQGSESPQARLSEAEAKRVLKTPRISGATWAKRLDVSPSTIYMLRRGVTWKHLPR